MNDNPRVITTDFEEVNYDTEMYYTAPQVAKEIQDTDIRVRHWADSFEDILNIHKENGRKKYRKKDIESLAFIKHLLDEKKWTHAQVRSYCSKQGFTFAEYDAGLINPQDPLGFQALASALSVEVDNKLNIFMDKLIQQVSDMNKNQLEQVSINLNEIVTDSLNEKMEELRDSIETNTSDLKNEIAISLDSKLDERFVKTEQSLEEMLEELKQTKQEFKIASVSIESIINTENPPSLFEKFRKKYFK